MIHIRLRELISPTDGIFSHMPTDIWGTSFDAGLMDFEFFCRYGNLDVSMLVEMYTVNGVLNKQALSNLIYTKYRENWLRMFDAVVKQTYDIKITTTQDYTRKIERKSDDLRTDDLTHTVDLTDATNDTTNNTLRKTGTEANTGADNRTLSLTDQDTKNLSTVTTNSGTDKITDTFNETNSITNTTTKSGSESRDTQDDNTKNLTNTKTGTEAIAGEVINTGTVTTGDDKSEYGFGNAAKAPSESSSTLETRNTKDANTSTTTYNTTDATTGTDNHVISDTLTFNNRADTEDGTNQHTGTNTTETAHGLTSSSKETGTDTTLHTGTDNHELNNTTTYDTTDAAIITTNGTDKRTGTEKDTGTVKNEGKAEEEEKYSSQGSSALKTFQDLINEEIAGRSGAAWNFLELIMDNVKYMTTVPVWRRESYFNE